MSKNKELPPITVIDAYNDSKKLSPLYTRLSKSPNLNRVSNLNRVGVNRDHVDVSEIDSFIEEYMGGKIQVDLSYITIMKECLENVIMFKLLGVSKTDAEIQILEEENIIKRVFSLCAVTFIYSTNYSYFIESEDTTPRNISLTDAEEEILNISRKGYSSLSYITGKPVQNRFFVSGIPF